MTSYAVKHEARFFKQIEAKSRIGKLNRISKRLYEDNVLGKISEERFELLSSEYEAE